jgi:hypothetical protein
MAVNDRFAQFLIRLATDDDFREQFRNDPAGTMEAAALSDTDREVLLSGDTRAYRSQIENVQISGQENVQISGVRATARAKKSARPAKKTGAKKQAKKSAKKSPKKSAKKSARPASTRAGKRKGASARKGSRKR